jgi:hypothetical protein
VKTDRHVLKRNDSDLFDRIAAILEQARSNVVRAVNSNTVVAYWLIGWGIVQEIQRRDDRWLICRNCSEYLSILPGTIQGDTVELTGFIQIWHRVAVIAADNVHTRQIGLQVREKLASSVGH